MRDFFNELRRRNVVRVVVGYFAFAWLIIQVLETVFPLFDIADAYIRWVIIGLAILFIPVVAFSWVFEWSVSGIVSQADLDRGDARPAPATRKFDRVIIVALSVAVLYFAADKFLFPAIGLGVDQPRSIAVLPFVDRTEAQDQSYLGDGLAEDLLRQLSRNPELRVAAGVSSFSFRNSALSIGEIAKQLGVSHVLVGSIQNMAKRQRISVQLVSGKDGFNVWTDVFDRDPDELFTLAADIRSSVESALEVDESSRAPRDRTPVPEAYVLALRASYLGKDNNEASRNAAIDLYLQALELDPNYALAWSNLATTYINQTNSGFLDHDEGYRKSRNAALQSVAVDAHHGNGYKALSFIARFFEGDMNAAVANMQRAMDEDAYSPEILADAAVLLLNIGQIDEAVRLDEFFVERSRVDYIGHFNLALAYRYADRLTDAEKTFRHVQKLQPEASGLNYQIGETLLLMGRHAEALAQFEAETDESYLLKGRALANFALGNNAVANEALSQLIEQFGEQWPSEVAHVLAYRGELDEAFVWLDKEFEAYGPGGWGEWQLQRLYDNLREDPRWLAFLNRTGTGPAQLAQLNLRIDHEF